MFVVRDLVVSTQEQKFFGSFLQKRTFFLLALRDLRGGLRGIRIVLACLALGVAAIAAVGSLRAAIDQGLAADGATLLGGEIGRASCRERV